MCKAIGREIRYVEYKLRRQQQEKKKKKQSRQDWLNGANSGGMSVRGHENFQFRFSTQNLRNLPKAYVNYSKLT